jgi:TM2 domain-containing membrane protein YozV
MKKFISVIIPPNVIKPPTINLCWSIIFWMILIMGLSFSIFLAIDQKELKINLSTTDSVRLLLGIRSVDYQDLFCFNMNLNFTYDAKPGDPFGVVYNCSLLTINNREFTLNYDAMPEVIDYKDNDINLSLVFMGRSLLGCVNLVLCSQIADVDIDEPFPPGGSFGFAGDIAPDIDIQGGDGLLKFQFSRKLSSPVTNIKEVTSSLQSKVAFIGGFLGTTLSLITIISRLVIRLWTNANLDNVNKSIN